MYCKDCGYKLNSNGICPWCDEETLIYEQNEENGMIDESLRISFSEEFLDKVDEQSRLARKRLERENEQ
jgi:hypothetical protein